MNIIRNDTDSLRFDTLEAGDVFEPIEGGCVFMKIDKLYKDKYNSFYNAVCLNDGFMIAFGDNDNVKKINAKVIVE